MKSTKAYTPSLVLLFIVLLAVTGLYAQVEEDEGLPADLTDERVSDAFQENFFAALREAAIENYDRAIEFLERIPEADTRAVVQYELAKNQRELRRLDLASRHIRRALALEPANEWYWHELLTIYSKLGKANWSTIRSDIPDLEDGARAAAVRAFVRRNNYSVAEGIVSEIGDMRLREELRELVARKRDLTRPDAVTSEPDREPAAERTQQKDPDTVEEYRSGLEALQESGDYSRMEALALKAMKEYPLQTSFAVFYARALNQKREYGQARDVLEEARAFLIDETDEQGRSLLGALLDAYRGLGDNRSATKIEAILNRKSP